MDIYKLLLAVVLVCVLNEGLAWWGGSRSSSSRGGSSRRSSSGSSSSRRSSGWWGRRRNQPSNPAHMKKVIEGYEEMNLKANDAQPKNPNVHGMTIGIGFNLNRDDANKTFEMIMPGLDFNKVKSGKQAITEYQACALFKHDIDNIYEPRAKNEVGKDVYDKLPYNVKTAIVNAVYRGDLRPKTADLIKQGKWDKVGKEYLDHEQYKNADKLGNLM